uniref:TetR/AcrR family transcriptional regulator n=1 Tax=Nakamurella sp. TaxID=1869182 RepID=UPI003B3A0927
DARAGDARAGGLPPDDARTGDTPAGDAPTGEGPEPVPPAEAGRAAATGPAARKPGRPREHRADRAIIGSTLEIFADEGYHALTIEAVAASAGVGKATIYRRWPGKKELVIDALASLNDELMAAKAHLPPTIEDCLRMVLHHLTTRDPESLLGRITPRMLVYSESQPDLYAEYFDRVIVPRRRWLNDLLREGVARGVLRPDLDVEIAALALVGPALMPARGLGVPATGADLADRLFDVLWPAFRADPDGRTPSGSGRAAISD